jgi:drug/metabolite transporter (DMT)-like permease
VHNRRGVIYALAAAVLFGASTPCAKLLLAELPAILLAGLMYLGSGIGLWAWRLTRGAMSTQATEAHLSRRDLPWLAAAVAIGGISGPVLLMWGLARTPATTASLLLNLEGVFTALLAWFAFHEHFDRRIALGMFAIAAGGVLVSWSGTPEPGVPWGILAIVGACGAWALDNNLTRKLSAADPVQIAALKGLVAGATNIVIAALLGTALPSVTGVLLAGTLGLLGYGASLVLFILALRHLGTARTGTYFLTAPFIGAAMSFAFLREPLRLAFWVAAGLMGVGVWLHVTEHHAHEHRHEPFEHDHWHEHDEHHQHDHAGNDADERHTHPHCHMPLCHAHPHYPDLHHRHDH